jgi:uncharacterized membrane protein HdeD (DUF308 family)
MTTAANAGGGKTTPWWLVLLEGIFAAIFGLLLLTAPGATLIFVVRVLGFYLLTEGILRIVSIFVSSSLWGLKLGIGILAGMVVLNLLCGAPLRYPRTSFTSSVSWPYLKG